NDYVGRSEFREGVRRYIREHAFGNTVDNDLWKVIQDAANKPILDIERDFTRRQGVPLIHVTQKGAMTILSEGRFAADPSTISKVAAQIWHLPITVKSLSTGELEKKVMSKPTQFALPVPVLVNAGQTAYARVLYSDAELAVLIQRMALLSSADQLGLLNDTL